MSRVYIFSDYGKFMYRCGDSVYFAPYSNQVEFSQDYLNKPLRDYIPLYRLLEMFTSQPLFLRLQLQLNVPTSIDVIATSGPNSQLNLFSLVDFSIRSKIINLSTLINMKFLILSNNQILVLNVLIE